LSFHLANFLVISFFRSVSIGALRVTLAVILVLRFAFVRITFLSPVSLFQEISVSKNLAGFSLYLVIRVLSRFKLSYSSVERNSLISFLICIARSLLPIIAIKKSSAYLTYFTLI